ncbi:inositol monophosphatase family protein [Nonomuraea sediminis]|uniref:inositol monophosphatase family protein n=1 Tax=Nonomuraea sediminis TaxID=2835864 RepID=UPI001BDDAB01|nr:inositol monophosphatase family protein [Nonomuraea sediminis]
MSRFPMTTLATELVSMVTTVIGEVRPRLINAALSGDRRNRVNKRHADNFLSDFDILLHERYRELFAKVLPSFVYASEEADPQVIGSDPDPDLCVLVDPLDTSEMAVRALYGYTHVMVYSRHLARPIAAVVGDFFHHLRLYMAIRDDDGQDHASLITADDEQHRLQVGEETALNEALVTNFLMKPDRFRYLAKQAQLIDALQAPAQNGATLGRIGVDFGSISLCHVAAGFTDATLEVLKGFAVWDLAPGHYILQAAGGSVIDLAGNALPLDYGFGTLTDIGHAMDRRQTFVAASSDALAQAIAAKVRES